MIEYDFDSEVADIIAEEAFVAALRGIGLIPYPFDEVEDYEYSIAFFVKQFEDPNEFFTMEYTIYYRDTCCKRSVLKESGCSHWPAVVTPRSCRYAFESQ